MKRTTGNPPMTRNGTWRRSLALLLATAQLLVCSPAFAGEVSVADAGAAAGRTDAAVETVSATSPSSFSFAAQSPLQAQALMQAQSPAQASAQPSDATGNLVFGVISDVHINDGASVQDEKFAKALDTLKADAQTLENTTLAAVVIAGDLTNKGTLAQYARFAATWNTHAPAGTQKLFAMGNHDYWDNGLSASDAQTRFTAKTGEAVSSHKIIEGYHLIQVSTQSGPTGGDFAGAVAWLKAELEKAAAADPLKPIFVTFHQHLQDTVYGSDDWGNATLYETIKPYPQVITFSGHSHYALNDERSIHQADFTSVGTASLSYLELESGMVYGSIPPGAGNFSQGLLVSVDKKTQKVTLKRLDFHNNAILKQDWVVDPAQGKPGFTYTAARSASATAPVFGTDAKATASGITTDSAGIAFSQATDADMVHSYRIDAKNLATGKVDKSIKIFSEFYFNPAPKQLNQSLSGLSDNTDYEVRIHAINSWGKESATPLTTTLHTLKSEIDLSVPRPVADVFDFDFLDGKPTDRSIQHDDGTIVSAAAIRYDDSIKKQVLALQGNDNQFVKVPFSYEQKALVTKTFSLETVFKVHDIRNQGIIENCQGGGIGLEMTGDGTTEIWVRINGSYVRCGAPLEANRYYHAVATYDGSHVALYIDGKKVAEAAASGDVQHPDMHFALSGDPDDAGAGIIMNGNLSVARLYSKALSLSEINRMYQESVARAGIAGIGDLYAVRARLVRAAKTETDSAIKTSILQLAALCDTAWLKPDVTAGEVKTVLTQVQTALSGFRRMASAKRATPLIDGKMDETAWNERVPISEALTADAAESADMGLLWDDQFLYVGMSMTDDELIGNGSVMWFDQDHISLFLDPTQHRSSPYQGMDLQIGIGYAPGTSVPNFKFGAAASNTDRNESLIKRAISKTATGWAMEAAIPWSMLGITPAANKSLGFDVMATDRDSKMPAESVDVLAWNTSGKDSFWNDTAGFGTLVLSSETAAIGQLTRLEPAKVWAVGTKGQPVPTSDLVLYGIYADGTRMAVSAGDIEWTSSDESVVNTKDSVPTFMGKGVAILTGTVSGISASLTVIGRNAATDDFVLYEENFDQLKAGALPEGWKRVEGSTADKAVVTGSAFEINALATPDNPSRVLLPEFLGQFGDYRIEADVTTVKANDAARWTSIMYRVQNSNYPYYQMAVRQNAAAANGVEFAERTPANGWNVQEKGSFTEALSATKSYHYTVQVFGSRVRESINGKTILDNNLATAYAKGRIGFQSNGSFVRLDNIKVTLLDKTFAPLPADSFAHVKEPETSLIAAPTTVAELLGNDAVEKAVVSQAAASLLLQVKPDLTVRDKAGALLGKVSDFLPPKLGIIPVFQVEDEPSAIALAGCLNENAAVDVFVLSTRPELVKTVRLACPTVRGILDMAMDHVPNKTELMTLIGQVNKSRSKVVILPESALTRENVRFLQQRLMTVWGHGGNDALSMHALLAKGVNGIVTAQPDLANTVLNSYTDANTLARAPFIIGHRGLPSKAPENTMASERLAFEKGADMLETDIYVTTDNQLVCIHDGTLTRTTNGTGNVEDKSLAELKALKANNGFTSAYPSEGIPSLAEMLDAFKDKDVVLFVEIKSAKANVQQLLVEMVKAKKMEDQVVVITFNTIDAVRLAELMPEMSVGFLTGMTPETNPYANLLKIQSAQQTLSTTYNPSYSSLNAETQRIARHRGMTFWPWTYGDMGVTVQAILSGTNGLTTNNTDDLSEVYWQLSAAQNSIRLKSGEKTALSAQAENYVGGKAVVSPQVVVLDGSDVIASNGTSVTALKDGVAHVLLKARFLMNGTAYTLYSEPVEIQVNTASVNPPAPPQNGPVAGSPSAAKIKYALSIKTDGKGTVLPGSGSFDSDTTIMLRVIPEAGYVLARWEGQNGNEVSGDQIKMTGNKSLTAVFRTPAEMADEAARAAASATAALTAASATTPVVIANEQLPQSGNLLQPAATPASREQKWLAAGLLGETFNETLTQAEAIGTVLKAAGVKPATKVTLKLAGPVPTWTKGYLQTALNRGWISVGKGKAFPADASITRQELASLLGHAFGWKPSALANPYKDANRILSQHKTWVAAARERKILIGFSDNTFRPAGVISRGTLYDILLKSGLR